MHNYLKIVMYIYQSSSKKFIIIEKCKGCDW